MNEAKSSENPRMTIEQCLERRTVLNGRDGKEYIIVAIETELEARRPVTIRIVKNKKLHAAKSLTRDLKELYFHDKPFLILPEKGEF